MQISRRRWHYRLLSWLNSDGGMPTNLCAYFGEVIFVTTVLPVAMLAILPVWLPILICLWLKEQWRAHRGVRERQPSLLAAWVRAKKAKVCPRLEWVE